MRFFAALLVLSVLPHAAFAETKDCKTIADPAARLTCYDKINPPIASYPIPLPKPSHPIPTTRPEASAADPQSDDDALVRAQRRNVCRGC